MVMLLVTSITNIRLVPSFSKNEMFILLSQHLKWKQFTKGFPVSTSLLAVMIMDILVFCLTNHSYDLVNPWSNSYQVVGYEWAVWHCFRLFQLFKVRPTILHCPILWVFWFVFLMNRRTLTWWLDWTWMHTDSPFPGHAFFLVWGCFDRALCWKFSNGLTFSNCCDLYCLDHLR
jgi:hypothetical protein